MIKRIMLIGLMAYVTSCNKGNDVKSSCREIPEFVIEKDTIDEKIIIIKCYLDDNTIHQFNDGLTDVNIIPLMRNETTNKKLYVQHDNLVGLDTIPINSNIKEVKYTITFPNPKGGDVRLLKVVR